jgi:hypothetical protein
MTMATPALFSALKIKPLPGRTFTEKENRAGGDGFKAVLTHSLWQETFGGDPQILGRTIRLRGASYFIIGLMPPDFQYPNRTEIWVSLQARYAGYVDEWWKHRDMRIPAVLGRLRITAEGAQSDLQSIAAWLAGRFPTTNNGVRIRLTVAAPNGVGPTAAVSLAARRRGHHDAADLLRECQSSAGALCLPREGEGGPRGHRRGQAADCETTGRRRSHNGLAGGLLGAAFSFPGVLALIPVPLPPAHLTAAAQG